RVERAALQAELCERPVPVFPLELRPEDPCGRARPFRSSSERFACLDAAPLQHRHRPPAPRELKRDSATDHPATNNDNRAFHTPGVWGAERSSAPREPPIVTGGMGGGACGGAKLVRTREPPIVKLLVALGLVGLILGLLRDGLRPCGAF